MNICRRGRRFDIPVYRGLSSQNYTKRIACGIRRTNCLSQLRIDAHHGFLELLAFRERISPSSRIRRLVSSIIFELLSPLHLDHFLLAEKLEVLYEYRKKYIKRMHRVTSSASQHGMSKYEQLSAHQGSCIWRLLLPPH